MNSKNAENLSLAELQISLQHYLLNEKNIVNEFTSETANFSRGERLGIYHEAYRLRLIDALRNDFPALEKFVGENSFIEFMDNYIAAHPSQHPSLRWFGKKLPAFLHDNENIQHHIATCELAEFEWAQVMAFDASNSNTATLDDVRTLQNTQWLTLQLEFQPALQKLHLKSNAPEIWQALTKDDDTIEPVIDDEAQDWLVWRDNLQVVYRAVDTKELWCLNAFLDGKNFSDICEGLCQWFESTEVPSRAAQYLQRWLQNGLVTKIITESDE